MGKITNIQRFCVDDGPGIRTTVFLSGCPLRCLWCHNPETERIAGAILFDKARCLSCGACAAICEHHTIEDGVHIFHGDGCIGCGRCLSIGCGALSSSAKEATVEEIIETVKLDEAFYSASGGGVTFSGGEPTQQYEFLLALVKGAKEAGLHVCLETSGYTSRERILALAKYVDLFLYDCKLTDEEGHLRYTGVPLKPILQNLEALDEAGAKILLRCPIIPTVNDDEAHFRRIGELADRYDAIREVHILPYHELGEAKRERMGKSPSPLKIIPVSDEVKRSYLQKIKTKKKIIL